MVGFFGLLKSQTATETPAAVQMFLTFYAVWIVWYEKSPNFCLLARLSSVGALT